jgi:heme-degrading monooxygenase HmoA
VYARIWTGWTARDRGPAYAAFLAERAVPDYRRVPGNLAVHVLRREDGERAEFTVVTFWESLEAVRSFAGDDISVARFYPEDDEFLLERGPVARHYEVTATTGPATAGPGAPA